MYLLFLVFQSHGILTDPEATFKEKIGLIYATSRLYSHWVPVLELLGITIMILSIYQAVVAGEPRAAVMAVGVGAAYSWFLKQLASVHEASDDVVFVAEGTPSCS